MKFRSATILAVATVAFAATSPALAAKWETVASASTNGDRMEIDRGRIAQQAGGHATAWSRLARDGIYVDEHGQRYTAIEAFNRYDCAKGSFTTLKRVWRLDDRLVREETVERPLALPVEAGSNDARMLAEACRLPVAEVGARDKPGVMTADMRSAGDAAKGKPMPVADAGHADKKAADKPAEKAAAPAPAPTGEKPRFIELPKIDKSQVEDPNKPHAAKAAEPAKEAKAPAKGAPDIKEVAKAAGAAAAQAPAPAANRQELERQYATSGPRKTVKKKASAEHAAMVEHRHIHWSYEGEGAPANWSKLDAKYATCASGKRQSPIDIREGIKVDLEPIKFDYKWANFRVVDNGHTIQVNLGEGNSISVMGRSYQLVQFHFHRPSEEKVRGKAFDMVAHLVHKDDEGRLAVVAVLMEKGATEHPLIQTLWNNMPLEVNQDVSPSSTIDLNRILPEERSYYTYMGSLTTPPCTEDVLWMVLKKPIIVTEQQVAIFARLYKNNARPVQPANERLIKESR